MSENQIREAMVAQINSDICWMEQNLFIIKRRAANVHQDAPLDTLNEWGSGIHTAVKQMEFAAAYGIS